MRVRVLERGPERLGVDAQEAAVAARTHSGRPRRAGENGELPHDVVGPELTHHGVAGDHVESSGANDVQRGRGRAGFEEPVAGRERYGLADREQLCADAIRQPAQQRLRVERSAGDALSQRRAPPPAA